MNDELPSPENRPPIHHSSFITHHSSFPSRSGVALILVLLIIFMALGLSYAAVRSQFTGLKIQQNADRRISARQAAVTGLTMAIKNMHTASWNGVGTTLTGSLGADQGFQVTYSTGDPSLGPGHPDYGDFPYRVTLLSTGSATDPDNPASVATYQIRAVVRLVPRQLGPEPADWDAMQEYTVFQSKKDNFELDIPFRIEGPVRIQGKLKTAFDYPNASDSRWRYLGDLNAMRLSGLPDYRPFNSTVDLPFVEQDWSEVLALTNQLGVTADNLAVDEPGADWTKPTSLISYQIYEGGPTYTIPTVGATLQNTSLGPDPLTNPLGVYYRAGMVDIGDDVTIRGTLFCRDDIKIRGTNVHLQPVELPALHGSAAPVRLPVATCRNFFVESTAGGDLTGLLAVFGRFEVKKSPETVEFAVTGRVVTRSLYIKERQPWEILGWGEYYGNFQDQEDDGEPYFPVWMGYQDRNPEPLLTIKPDSGPITYHWHYPGDRIYEPHPDDLLIPCALRWDLIQWTENP